MRRVFHDHRSLVIAFWIVAGALLLGRPGPVAAQGATPSTTATVTQSSTGPIGPLATMVLASDETGGVARITRAEMEPGPTGGGGAYALGALVGAVVAVVAALRERFTKR